MSQEESLVLAALLHDIGVFWQLTCQLPDDEARNHAALSGRFILDHFGDRYSQAASMAAAHHQPDDYPGKLLRLATVLASGTTDQGENGPQCAQLQSILSRMGGSSPRYFRVKPLDQKRDVLIPKPDPDGDLHRSFSELWASLVRETEAVVRLHGASFTALADTLFYVLCKHTWCIPVACPGGVADVSLFDHLRATCAVALGLLRSGITESEVDSWLQGKLRGTTDKPRLSLIGGELCGVQRFVYASGPAASATGVRGRALYVEALTETMALLLLRHLHLYGANLLYVDGGRFLVLCHFVDDEDLASFRRGLSQALLKHHQGELHLALVSEGLHPDDFDKFPAAWARVEQRLVQARRRPFGDMEAGQLHECLFRVQGGGAASDVCGTCGADGARWSAGAGEERECDLCRSMMELAQQAAGASHLLINPLGETPSGTRFQGWQNLFFFGLGVEVQFLRDVHGIAPHVISGGGTLLCLGSTDILTADVATALGTAKNPPALGFRLVSQRPAEEKAGTAEATELASMARASTGASLVGALRMHVDRLNRLFRHGLGEGAGLSRFCSLSFQLHVLFGGLVSGACSTRNVREGSGIVYPIYTGGDDVFAVGSWSEIPELAWGIHRDLSDFAGSNPLVHISGGTSVGDPHMSVHHLFEAARESLEYGARAGEGKNAFDFLGLTLGWSRFQNVIAWRDTLARIVATDGEAKQGKAPPALLHLLMRLHQCYADGQQANAERQPLGDTVLHYGPWMWQAAHHLSRMMGRTEGRARSELAQIREALTDPTRLSLALPELALAARWLALLRNKERQ